LQVRVAEWIGVYADPARLLADLQRDKRPFAARALLAGANGEGRRVLLRVTRFQRYEHVQASAARGLRERDEPVLVEDRPQRLACADSVGELPTARIEVEREPIRFAHRADARVHDVHRDAAHPDEAEERLEVAADDVIHVLAGALGPQPEPRRINGDVAFGE